MLRKYILPETLRVTVIPRYDPESGNLVLNCTLADTSLPLRILAFLARQIKITQFTVPLPQENIPYYTIDSVSGSAITINLKRRNYDPTDPRPD